VVQGVLTTVAATAALQWVWHQPPHWTRPTWPGNVWVCVRDGMVYRGRALIRSGYERGRERALGKVWLCPVCIKHGTWHKTAGWCEPAYGPVSLNQLVVTHRQYTAFLAAPFDPVTDAALFGAWMAPVFYSEYLGEWAFIGSRSRTCSVRGHMRDFRHHQWLAMGGWSPKQDLAFACPLATTATVPALPAPEQGAWHPRPVRWCQGFQC